MEISHFFCCRSRMYRSILCICESDLTYFPLNILSMSRYISLIFVTLLSIITALPVFAGCPPADLSTPKDFIIGCSEEAVNSVGVDDGAGKE